jgi:glycosyltransferase involved in cell wall biosynthesis
MLNPAISVIIPTYNREKSLKRCLRSLENQTFKDFEVIICDDGSTDNTKKIINYFKTSLNIKYIFLNKNSGGPAVPRNVGINNSKAKYLAFLDSDDSWKSTKLKKSLEFLNLGYDFVYHDLQVKSLKFAIKFNLNLILFFFFFHRFSIYNKLLLFGNKIPNSSVVVRADLIKKIGGFNESKQVVAMEDYLAWLKLSRVTNKFKKINKVLGFYNITNDNLSSPDKIIKYINVFNNIYKDKFKSIPFKSSPWTHLSIAKCNFIKRCYVSSIFNILKYIWCVVFIFFNINRKLRLSF